MTEAQFILLLCLGLTMALDLVVAAARSGFNNANLARVLAIKGQRQAQAERVVTLLNPARSMRLRIAFNMTQQVLRFLAAGLALLIFSPGNQGSPVILVILVALAVSALILAWLEWLVEERTARAPEEWALKLATLSQALSILFYPVEMLSQAFVSPPHNADMGTGPVTEDELNSLVAAGQQEGVLEQDERKMIYSIFRLGNTLAREIMVPRIDVTALDVHTPFDQAIDQLMQSGFSRVPVYDEAIDNVLGLLYTKDLLKMWREGGQVKSLEALLRPAYFVPEAKKVDELLSEMQSQRIHMAVIVDEYGGVAGLVTLEDIVEEIVGEIHDEFDQSEELPYTEIRPGEFVFQGRIDLNDFNEIMGSHLPREEAETLSGFIYNHFGRVPASGESVQVNNLLLTVTQVSGRRIRKVRAQWAAPVEEDEKENPNAER